MVEHRSDCAVHNEPAVPAGACDCGVDSAVAAARAEVVETIAAWVDYIAAELRTRKNGDPTQKAVYRIVITTLTDAADAIRLGAPQRWAAERETTAAPAERPETDGAVIARLIAAGMICEESLTERGRADLAEHLAAEWTYGGIA